MIYLLNFLLIPLYYLIIRAIAGSKNKAKIPFFFIVGLHVVLFRALANPFVYVDTEGYAVAFSDLSFMGFSEAMTSAYTVWGHGYIFLNWLVGRFTNNPNMFFFVLSVLSVGGVMAYYYKSSQTPLTTVSLYLLYPMMYLMGFGVVRQHFAIVFTLWALYYMDNLKLSLVLTVLGVISHTSALVIVPFYLIRHLELRNLNLMKLFAYSAAGFVTVRLAASYFVSYFTRYEGILDEKGAQRNIVPVIMIGSILIVYFITGLYKKNLGKRDAYIIRYLIYGFIIAVFGMTVPVAGRLSLYVIYVLPVAISVLYKNASSDKHLICNLYSAFLYVAIAILIMLSSSTYETYKFYWEHI